VHVGKEAFGTGDVAQVGAAAPAGPAVPSGAAVPGSCGTLAPFPP
jgi:hypothetical protein